ncbi:hypothetical protein BHE74_00030820 [Ensete ventricosum]|nr:hypothetical protein BHE74_00030820 [Ensete ventricosum]
MRLDGANNGRPTNTRTRHPHLGHVTVSQSRTYVGCRPGLGKVNWKIQSPDRSAAHLIARGQQRGSATGGMAERTRWADQPAAPLTTGGWWHGRVDATGRPVCNTPDNRRLAAWQSECDGPISLQHP